MSALWDFAKQIAQSDGRKNDWVYIMDIYKSIGGKEMAMFIITNNGKFEVLGEASPDLVLLANKQGELSTIKKSEMKKYRKKFYKRDFLNYEEVKKSVTVNGKKITTTVFLEKN